MAAPPSCEICGRDQFYPFDYFFVYVSMNPWPDRKKWKRTCIDCAKKMDPIPLTFSYREWKKHQMAKYFEIE